MANFADINQEVSLGLNVAGAIIPVVSGIVKSIQSRSHEGQIEYTVVMTTGQGNLDTAAANFNASIADIDAQLAQSAQSVASVIHNPGQ